MVKIVSYNCNSIRNNIEIVQMLTEDYDIVCLQELMLFPEDLGILSRINDNFDFVADVKD